MLCSTVQRNDKITHSESCYSVSDALSCYSFHFQQNYHCHHDCVSARVDHHALRRILVHFLDRKRVQILENMPSHVTVEYINFSCQPFVHIIRAIGYTFKFREQLRCCCCCCCCCRLW